MLLQKTNFLKSSKILNTKSTSRFSTSIETQKPRVLFTGGLGQIGSELSEALKSDYGVSNVIVTDVKNPPSNFKGTFHFVDVTNRDSIEKLVVDYKIDWLIHLTSLLSVSGEKDPDLAIKVNVGGFQNALDVARKYNLRIFAPSSIAAFGPSTPQHNTPDIAPLFPTTIYGVTKVYLELLGTYYSNRYHVDFRSVRYPGIIGPGTPPGGGTTDYAVEIFYEALKKGSYVCPLGPQSALPMMYMPDCIEGTKKFLEADPSTLTQRVYNITAMSFTPQQLADSITKYIPSFQIKYNPDPRKQSIADSWPKSINDSNARNDWKWNPYYNLDRLTTDMLVQLNAKFKQEEPNKPLMELKNLN